MSSDSARPMPLAQEAPLVEVIDSTSPATAPEVRRRRQDAATDADNNTAQNAAADTAVDSADEGDATTEDAPQEYHGRGGLQTAVHQKVISQKVKAANTRTELQMEERQLREKLMLVQENLRRKEQQQQQHQQQREREEAAGYLSSAYATENLPAFPRVHDATSTVDGSAAAASSASPKQARGRLATPTRTHDPYATSGHISETEIDPTTALSLSGSHNVHPRGTSPVVAGAHSYPASYSPHPQQQVSHHHQRSPSQQFVAVRQQSFDGVDADVMPSAPAVGAAAVMGPAAPLPRGSVGVRPQRSSRASSVGSHHDGSQPDVDAAAATAQQANAGQNAVPSPTPLPLQCDAIQASGELPPRPASSTPRRNPYSSGTPNQNSRRGTPTARRVSPLQRRPPSPSAFAQAQLMNYDSHSAHSAHSATAAVGDASKPHNDSARGSNCSTPAAAAAIAAQLATSQQSHDGSAQAMDDGDFRRHNSHPEYDAYFHGDAEGAYHDQDEPVDLAITAAPSAVYPAQQQHHDQSYHHHMQDQMMTPPPPPFTQTDAALGPHAQQEEPIESPLVGPGNNESFSKMAAQISPRSAALEERSAGASSGARTPYAGAIDANGSVGSHVQGGQGGQSSQQGGARPAAGWPCVHRRSASSAGSAAGSYASYQHEPYATANMDPSMVHPQTQPSAQVVTDNSGAGGAFVAPHHRRGQSAGQRSTMSQGSGATGDRSPYAPSALNPTALTTGNAQPQSGPHSSIQSAQHSGQWHPSQQQHQQQYHPYEQPMDGSEQQAGAGHGQQSSRGSTPRPRTLYEMPTYADPGSALGTPMGQPGQGQPGFGDQPSGHTPRLQRTSSSGHAQRMQGQQGQQGQYQYQQSQHSQPFSSSTSSSQQASRRPQQHQQQQGGGYNDAYAYDVSFHVHPGTHHQRHGSQSQGSQQGSQRNSQQMQMQPSSQAQQQGQQVQHRHTMSDSFSLPSRVAQTALSASSCDAPLDPSKAQGNAVLPPPIDVESSAAAVGGVAVVTPSGVSPKPARKTVQVPAFEELDEVMQAAVQSVEQFVSFCKDCQWTKPHMAGDTFPAHRCECGQPVHLRCLVCDRVGRERRQWDQHVIGKKHLEARYLAAVSLTEGSNPTTTSPTPTAASAPAAMAQNTTTNNNTGSSNDVAGVQGGTSHVVVVGGGEQSARSPPPQQFQQQQQQQQPQYHHYEQQQFVQAQQQMQQAPQFVPQIGQMGYGSTTPPSGQAAAALPVQMTAVAALGGFVPQGPAAGAPQMYAQPPQNFQQYAM